MAPYKFSLTVGSLAPETFRVFEFTLDEALSECFRLSIQAGSDQGDLAYDDLIGKAATLSVAGSDFEIRHHGMVSEFRRHPDQSRDFGRESHPYELVIRPRLQALEHTSRNRVFLDKDALEIVSEVLHSSGLSSRDFKFDTTGTFPKREFTVQYNESDLNFVERLLEDEGVFYFFPHEADFDVVCFGDNIVCIREAPHDAALPYIHAAGLSHLASDCVTRLSLDCRRDTGKVTLQDYNYDMPQVKVEGQAARHGSDETQVFAPHARNHDEANRLAGIRAEMHEAKKNVVEGEGICRAFRCGYRFKLRGDVPAAFQGEFSLIRARHHGNQSEGFAGDQDKALYSTGFSCIASSRIFRPALRAAKPKIHGLLLAKVDGVNGPAAYLDDEGRYRCKMPFDSSSLADGQASLPIRMGQPYAGPNYGMHFPLHVGNDLVLGFLDGDADRPIALGAIPNPANGSPVTSRNKTESVIKTASGHRMRMDDLDGKTAIDIRTAGSHVFSLRDDPAERGISIATRNGHGIEMDDTGTRILIRSKYGHEVLLDDGNKTISVKTAGGHALEMDDPGKLITLVDGAGNTKVTLDGGRGNVEITASRDITINAGGSLTFSAGKLLSTSSGDGTGMTVGKGFDLSVSDTAKVTAGKNMELRASKNFLAAGGKGSLEMDKELQLKATKMLSSADSDFQAKAGKMTLESDGKMVFKGAQITQN